MTAQGHSTDGFVRWLEAAGRTFDYPPAPVLAARVAARLHAEPRSRRRGPFTAFAALPGPRWLHSAVAAVLLAAVVVGITAAVSPGARSALAEFFGLKRLQVIRIEETPAVRLTPTPGAEFDPVAGRTTLAEARRRVSFPLRVPTYPEGLGDPHAVYFQDFRPGHQVVLTYEARPELGLGPGDKDGLLFTLFQFKTEGIFVKLVPPGTQLAELTVNGEKAPWFEGAAHFLLYQEPSGSTRTDFQRVVTRNTLAWESGGITYRLETTLTKEEAVRIAESLVRR